MRSGFDYKHVAMNDVYMHVHKVQYDGPNYIKVRASLVHCLYKYVYETTTFKIYKSEIKNWKPYLPNNRDNFKDNSNKATTSKQSEKF